MVRSRVCRINHFDWLIIFMCPFHFGQDLQERLCLQVTTWSCLGSKLARFKLAQMISFCFVFFLAYNSSTTDLQELSVCLNDGWPLN